MYEDLKLKMFCVNWVMFENEIDKKKFMNFISHHFCVSKFQKLLRHNNLVGLMKWLKKNEKKLWEVLYYSLK